MKDEDIWFFWYLARIERQLKKASDGLRRETGLGGNCTIRDVLELEDSQFVNAWMSIEDVMKSLKGPHPTPSLMTSEEKRAEVVHRYILKGFKYQSITYPSLTTLADIIHDLKWMVEFYYPSTKRITLKRKDDDE